MVNSYFKCSPSPTGKGVDGVFTFDVTDRVSADKAFDAAKALRSLYPSTRISVWKKPLASGPWDRVDEIGLSLDEPFLVAL